MSNPRLVEDVRNTGRKVMYKLLAANLLFIAVTAFRGRPVWWSRFMGEQNMWTRGTALELLASSAVCALVYALCRYQAATGESPSLRPYLWLGVSLSFVYLAMDELFVIHERFQHAFHITDSVVILGYMVLASLLVRPLASDLRKSRGGLLFFLGGIAAVGISVAFDAVTHVRGPLMAVEEIFELLGACMFLLAFTAVLAAVASQVLTSALTHRN